MTPELKDELIIAFGTQMEDNIDELYDRICKTVAAMRFAGTVGDNPLCVLNRAFESI